MIDGKVQESDGHLFLLHPIRIEGPAGISNVYDAIVDTGFTGQVALPVTLCRVLELEYVRRTRTMFGNASFEDIDVYRANVFWGGVWQEVSVVATGTEILIGMNMLRGSSVCFDAVDEGSISIEPYDRTIR